MSDQSNRTKLEHIISEALDDDPLLYHQMFDYLEIYDAKNMEIIKSKLFNTRNGEIAAGAIKIIRKKIAYDKLYWDYILHLARGADWDIYDDAKLAAIFALKDYEPLDYELASVVALGLNSENVIIRDSILILAQFKAGVHPLDVQWGNRSENLLDKIPIKAEVWLSSVTQMLSPKSN